MVGSDLRGLINYGVNNGFCAQGSMPYTLSMLWFSLLLLIFYFRTILDYRTKSKDRTKSSQIPHHPVSPIVNVLPTT
jgi:hypothetical protein